MARALVVYFSRTGYTEKLAEELAERCDAHTEPIREARSRLGFFGYIRSAREALKGRPATIRPLLHDLKRYDLVIFGTPVWAGHVSSPVRAALDAHKDSLGRVAFFCTEHASGGEKVLQEMAAICGKEPVATLVATDAEIRQGSIWPKVDRFIQALGLAAAA